MSSVSGGVEVAPLQDRRRRSAGGARRGRRRPGTSAARSGGRRVGAGDEAGAVPAGDERASSGTNVVVIDMASRPWGSWKNVNAFEYASWPAAAGLGEVLDHVDATHGWRRRSRTSSPTAGRPCATAGWWMSGRNRRCTPAARSAGYERDRHQRDADGGAERRAGSRMVPSSLMTSSRSASRPSSIGQSARRAAMITTLESTGAHAAAKNRRRALSSAPPRAASP